MSRRKLQKEILPFPVVLVVDKLMTRVVNGIDNIFLRHTGIELFAIVKNGVLHRRNANQDGIVFPHSSGIVIHSIIVKGPAHVDRKVDGISMVSFFCLDDTNNVDDLIERHFSVGFRAVHIRFDDS